MKINKSKSIKACAMLAILFVSGCSSSQPTSPKTPAPGTAKEEITFKGIPLDQAGQKERLIGLCEEKKVENKGYNDFCKSYKSEERLYGFSVDYGTMINALMFFELDERGALVKIYGDISTASVPALVTVLSDKYGSPIIEKDELQNGLGNKLPRQIYSWKDAKGNRVTIHSIYKKIDEGHVQIESGSQSIKEVDNTQQYLKQSKERL